MAKRKRCRRGKDAPCLFATALQDASRRSQQNRAVHRRLHTLRPRRAVCRSSPSSRPALMACTMSPRFRGGPPRITGKPSRISMRTSSTSGSTSSLPGEVLRVSFVPSRRPSRSRTALGTTKRPAFPRVMVEVIARASLTGTVCANSKPDEMRLDANRQRPASPAFPSPIQLRAHFLKSPCQIPPVGFGSVPAAADADDAF